MTTTARAIDPLVVLLDGVTLTDAAKTYLRSGGLCPHKRRFCDTFECKQLTRRREAARNDRERRRAAEIAKSKDYVGHLNTRPGECRFCSVTNGPLRNGLCGSCDYDTTGGDVCRVCRGRSFKKDGYCDEHRADRAREDLMWAEQENYSRIEAEAHPFGESVKKYQDRIAVENDQRREFFHSLDEQLLLDHPEVAVMVSEGAPVRAGKATK